MLTNNFATAAIWLTITTAIAVTTPAAFAMDKDTAQKIDAAMAGVWRSDADRARDPYRKPRQVLSFLGFRSDMTVVEMWPGGGWYSKILAPALNDNGQFYAAGFDSNGEFGFQRRGNGALLQLMGENPDQFRNTIITEFDIPHKLAFAPKGSADMVLTFRNVHNWVSEMFAGGKYPDLAFLAMYDALKPGGVLGVVDHRWPDANNEDPVSKNGYVSVERTIALAQSAGFELVDQSDLLANPKDTHDHPRGVWTLPPTFALGEQDQAKYAAIGESDRYLLKFVKPNTED